MKRQPKEMFSFSKAVREAKADFPEETRNVTFLDLSTPGAREAFAHWIHTLDAPARKAYLQKGDVDEQFDELYTVHGFAAMIGDGSGRNLLVFAPDNASHAHFFSLQYIFDHELGHLIVPGAAPPPITGNGKAAAPKAPAPSLPPQQRQRLKMEALAGLYTAYSAYESAADSFAVLRGLKRGTMTPADVNKLSILRANRNWETLGFTHTTSVAIDALLLSQTPERLQALTPQQAKDLAAHNALVYAPGRDEMYDLMKALMNYGGYEDEGESGALKQLAYIVRTEPPGTLAFHIAGRLLGEAFRTGFVDYLGPLGEHRNNHGWRETGALLKMHAKRLGDIGTLMTDFDENKLDTMPAAAGASPFARLRGLKINAPWPPPRT